jgi:hypothetical protein
VLGEKIEEIPLGHQGNEAAMGWQVREVRHLYELVPNLGPQPADLLMRTAQKVFEQPQLVHQFQSRGVDRISAEIPQEIGVLLKNENRDPGSGKQESEHHTGRPATRDAAADRNLGVWHQISRASLTPPRGAGTQVELRPGAAGRILDRGQRREMDQLGRFLPFQARRFFRCYVIAVGDAVSLGNRRLGRNNTHRRAPGHPFGAQKGGNGSFVIGLRHCGFSPWG